MNLGKFINAMLAFGYCDTSHIIGYVVGKTPRERFFNGIMRTVLRTLALSVGRGLMASPTDYMIVRVFNPQYHTEVFFHGKSSVSAIQGWRNDHTLQ